MKKIKYNNIIISLLLILAAVVSFFIMADLLSSPQFVQKYYESIDEKGSTVLKLSGASAALSTGITFLKNDIATPVAEEIADYSTYFALIYTLLIAEKYLLPLLISASFKVIIPFACVIGIIAALNNSQILRRYAFRIFLFALVIASIIPIGTSLSDNIYDVYKDSINATITDSEVFNSNTSQLAEADGEKLRIKDILTSISESVKSVMDKASDLLNRFIQAFAVMILTCCVIPICIFALMIWLVKIISGVPVSLDIPQIANRVHEHNRGISKNINELKEDLIED